MSGRGRGRGRGGRGRGRRNDDGDEIEALEAAIAASAPEAGSSALQKPVRGSEVRAAATATGQVPPMLSCRNFDQLPLSRATLEGLKQAKYKAMTAIQRAALPHALAGRDVLGAAKTGSGKTLAFLVPLVEKLFRLRWSPADGLGAVVISPTRELAMQIFDTLRCAQRPPRRCSRRLTPRSAQEIRQEPHAFGGAAHRRQGRRVRERKSRKCVRLRRAARAQQALA